MAGALTWSVTERPLFTVAAESCALSASAPAIIGVVAQPFTGISLPDAIAMALLRNPWFERIWCVQEVVLAWQARVLYAGVGID